MSTKDKKGQNVLKNNGEGNEDLILRYRFTAYVNVAIKNQRNKFIKESRKIMVEESVEDFENIINESYLENYFGNNHGESYAQFLEFALKHVSKTEADVAFLHLTENYSLKETAKILNLNYSYVRNLLSKGIKKFKRDLEV